MNQPNTNSVLPTQKRHDSLLRTITKAAYGQTRQVKKNLELVGHRGYIMLKLKNERKVYHVVPNSSTSRYLSVKLIP